MTKTYSSLADMHADVILHHAKKPNGFFELFEVCELYGYSRESVAAKLDEMIATGQIVLNFMRLSLPSSGGAE